nr:transmembrane protein 107-like [Chelonoidis abingdonii]
MGLGESGLGQPPAPPAASASPHRSPLLVPDSAPTPAIGAHAAATVALLFFLFDQWDSSLYWWIFAFCSALPAAFEILLFVSVFGFKRKPL